ncbi:acetyltransferase, GNAT family [Nocardioidaceae bacterium Broad-1]|uniref:GNAT family N-acetyltransferase n=1 Tax=Nocardioides luteus TaxID=1844 RepID=UPI0002029348|nr:GNAT family protein [Nocardioides luteus]EGD44941.1 acetyltransferase, GNAT family [Nocardioidaceae bacterium Broad-1]MBG6099135.1 RimJ/RimL family protein N-acetyltransferase [Nocardioides luteus]
MTLPTTILTERLTLPLWTQADIEAIVDQQGRNGRQQGWHPQFPREDDRDAATMWVEGDSWSSRYIIRNGTVLGSIGFFGPPDAASDGTPETEVGYGLVEEARGWGFATEALKGLLACADAEGVRIRASVEPTNAASLRVLAKCGFTELRGADEDGHLVMARPVPGGRMEE